MGKYQMAQEKPQWPQKLFGLCPTWSSLAAIGNSKAAQSSYIWLIIVPLAANLMLSVNPRLKFNVFGEYIELTLALPFSWILLYFAALLFSGGTLVYNIRCPRIVRHYRTAREFEEARNGPLQLEEHAEEVNFGERESGYSFSSAFALSQRGQVSNRTMGEAQDFMASEFWSIRNFADSVRTPSRMTCALCYALGLILLTIILFQNLVYVVKMAIIY